MSAGQAARRGTAQADAGDAVSTKPSRPVQQARCLKFVTLRAAHGAAVSHGSNEPARTRTPALAMRLTKRDVSKRATWKRSSRLTFDMSGDRKHAKRAVGRPLDGMVGRSRYAEESQAAAPRFILHLHFLIREGVILQPFVRTRQHDFNIDRLL